MNFTEERDAASYDSKEQLPEDTEGSSIEIDWEDNSKKYEIVSQGEGGFDRVTRPDLKSAKAAAVAHEEATGNECEINLL